MGAKMFGARVKRLEDPSLLTGEGSYTDDFHLPDTLEAAFVRSPHSHAKINKINGKELTPFLINEINKESNNQTLKANVSLIICNADLAGKLSKEYLSP